MPPSNLGRRRRARPVVTNYGEEVGRIGQEIVWHYFRFSLSIRFSTLAHDVFISYSREDKLAADAACATLEAAGIRCWIVKDRTGAKNGCGTFVEEDKERGMVINRRSDSRSESTSSSAGQSNSAWRTYFGITSLLLAIVVALAGGIIWYNSKKSNELAIAAAERMIEEVGDNVVSQAAL